MSFERTGFHPAEILLPAKEADPAKWACVACDQYTSEPAYWEEADRLAGDAPSALRLILPECYLASGAERIPRIHAAMRRYLEDGVLLPAVRGFVLCERTTAAGTRTGLIGTVDLEEYSFERGAEPLIRPTEQTITSRLPPRLEIRRGAPVELTHIMILLDDPGRTVIEPLKADKASLRKLYDFELMLGGGRLAGWAAEGDETLSRIDRALCALLDRAEAGYRGAGRPMLFAVGDGNHSLATAKAAWEEIRGGLSPEERKTHPARYALCEIVNIHDEALKFEPIHRLLTGTDARALVEDWRAYAEKRGMSLSPAGSCAQGDHCFTLVSAAGEERIRVDSPEGRIPCETIQKYLDDYLSRHPEAGIDYIHGEASLRSLAERPGCAGFLLPDIGKDSFFADVARLGVLPRKTFSMGEAQEKRYYMEAKRI